MVKKCKKGDKRVNGKCVKYNGIYKNKKHKINVDALWIIISILAVLGILGMFAYGGERGWFKPSNLNKNIVNYLNTSSEIPSDLCSLDLSPNSIYVGEKVNGNIIDGKNSLCQVFASNGTVWSKVYEGYTDSNGVLVNTRNINVEGNFVFRAICDSNNNNRVDTDDCLTNKVELIVLPNPDDVCSETDGGNNKDTPGITNFERAGYMDYCLPVGKAVHEYWCDAGILKEGSFACDYGEKCVSTKSGGYCEKVDSGYNIGDIVNNVSDNGVLSDGSNSWDINLQGVETGGSCRLGARLSTSWDYANDECEGLQGKDGVKWKLYDSSGVAYSRIDTSPVSLGVELCPLSWDGLNNWKVEMSKIQILPDCKLNYEWNVEVYVCECDQ